MLKGVLTMFSSRSFMVSDLSFRSLIHFQFIFVYGVRECSNFILLDVAVWFSQHHVLKRLSFLHCIFLPPFVMYSLTISGWVYFWALYSVPLICVSVFVPVPYCFDYCRFVVQSEVRECDTSSSFLLSQDCFGYLGSSVFPYRF